MISKAQYRGRLSYEEYVKRFTMRQTVAQQSPLQRPQLPTKQNMTDAAKKSKRYVSYSSSKTNWN